MDITLERIIKELQQQNKKQFQLTDFLGINRNTFGNWKAGLNSSYKKYIYAISQYLNVPVEYLRGEIDIKESSPPSFDNGLSPTQKELIALFESAAPELQSAVLAVLKVHAVQPPVPDVDKATQ